MPRLNVELDVKGVIKAFKKAQKQLNVNVPMALEIAAQLAATEATDNHDFKDQTGALKESIQAGSVDGSFEEGSLEVTVGAGAPHAIFIEEGTKPHWIDPVHMQALAWEVEGGKIVVGEVYHPGTKPFHFLKNAVEKTEPQAVELIEDAAKLSFFEAGFEVD